MARKSRKDTIRQQNQSSIDPIDRSLVKAYEPAHIHEDVLLTAAYIRRSSYNGEEEEDESINTQVQLVESFIEERNDLALIETFVDNGYSGTNFDRPEFQRMMDGVKRGKIQCIVVKDLSRFGRDYLETGYYIEDIFPLLNVRLIAITDHFDSFCESDRDSISIPVKNMVNAMFAKDCSRKQEVSAEMRIKSGKFSEKNVPYGYRLSAKGENMVIDEETAPYVRMIFAWALSGVKRFEIAKRLEALGAPTPAVNKNRNHGSKWTHASITAILYNPTYAGFLVMGKTKKSLYRGIEHTSISRDNWVYFPGSHEPYITMEDYEKIEGMIQENKAKHEKQIKTNESDRETLDDCFHLMVHCKECGRNMKYHRESHHHGHRDLSFQYYSCECKDGSETNNKKRVYQNFLKIVVMDQIKALVNTVIDQDAILRKIQTGAIKNRNVEMISRNISRLEANEKELDNKVMKAYIDHADGLLDDADFCVIKDKYTHEEQETIQKKAELENKLSDMEKSVKRFQKLAKQLEQHSEITEFDPKLVKELISEIWIGRDGEVEIIFRCADVFQNALLSEYMSGIQEG